jgi:hypothetical protein
MKPGPKPKLVCSKGHDISVVGRTKSGNCKKCKQEYSQVRQQFIKDNFKI